MDTSSTDSHEKISVSIEDGTSTKITVFSNDSKTNSPVIIIMPAMGVPATYYRPLALTIKKIGWHAITTDLRGIGTSSVRALRHINFGYHEMITYDWPAIINKVKTRFPTNQIFLLGHSLGGQINSLYFSINQNAVDGLILVAACSVFFKGWKFPLNIRTLLGAQFVYVVSLVLGYFPGKKIGFAGQEAKNVIKDWAKNSRTGRYEICNSQNDYEKALGQIKKPILAISFEKDPLSPKRAVLNLITKMKEAKITYLYLNTKTLRLKKVSHFSWVKTAGPIMLHVKNWINKLENR
ncbi:MAG: alpha/beta hydrolase family protein [Candidatus Hodarchaeales archaeon]|jgi:predicted alpha/beta hydrolase